MSYTVQKLADISGVTVRTLHYYDEVGLLTPSRVKNNGYRFYEEKELLKLQQIMFFRELDFPIAEIQKIMQDPKFDMTLALKDHKKMIELKRKRLEKLSETIDKTIKRLELTDKEKNMKDKMQDKELYESFKEHNEKYADEVKERWGNTAAYKQSRERVAKMSKEDMIKIKRDGDVWMKNFALHINENPGSKKVQELIAQHYNSLRTFYEPSIEMYRGLANMYVDDPRFTAYYEKYAKGLAVFMREAMLFYCDTHK